MIEYELRDPENVGSTVVGNMQESKVELTRSRRQGASMHCMLDFEWLTELPGKREIWWLTRTHPSTCWQLAVGTPLV